MLGALAVLLIGQPSLEDRWARIAPERQAQLANREVQVEPEEVLDKLHDHRLNLQIIDIRPEADYNVFHIAHSRHLPGEMVLEAVPELLLEPPNTVFIVVGNGETASTEVWKHLVAAGLPNVYIMSGGLNSWLDHFAGEDPGVVKMAAMKDDDLTYQFPAAYGARYHAASPDPHEYELEYEPKIELEIKRGPPGQRLRLTSAFDGKRRHLAVALFLIQILPYRRIPPCKGGLQRL